MTYLSRDDITNGVEFEKTNDFIGQGQEVEERFQAGHSNNLLTGEVSAESMDELIDKALNSYRR